MSLPTVLPEADRAVLSARVKATTTTQRDALRARIILALAEQGVRATARRLGCAVATVTKWRARYAAGGLAALVDRPRSGAPARYGDQVRRDVAAAATSEPPDPYSTWSHQRLADHLTERQAQAQANGAPAGVLASGPSPTWVGRALRQARIRIHRVRGWLHRKADPRFAACVGAIEDAVAAARAGAATVVCLDEKTAVSVRTPIHPDTYGGDGTRRREFEYRRAGTVSWYGTQDVATGAVALRRAEDKMDSQAFTMVLDDLVAAHGGDLTIIMDNGSAQRPHRALDAPPPRRHDLTPVHASWAWRSRPARSSRAHLDADAQHWTQLTTGQRPRTANFRRPLDLRHWASSSIRALLRVAVPVGWASGVYSRNQNSDMGE